ncbi:hypothetical protein JTE90_028359 [Oedothorax gibbosus]|uniref:C2H2-type domain-containing protein n=1 Tax=Oedothorax gibbosus TaxID=931172 RepID=A0AAV6TRA1_9ARAC|nr:hypothetical protein JTE90_028359 [Oedothorax gibbosus]
MNSNKRQPRSEPTTLSSPSSSHHNDSLSHSSKPLITIERRSPPASSQELSVPPTNSSTTSRTRRNGGRRTANTLPPLGSKTNDPASIPTAPTRINNSLHLPFPIAPSLKCPEISCHCAPFHASSWTASKQSLIRHLYTNHGITINNTEKWCTLCHERTPSKVSDHACFKDHPHVLSLINNLQFRCQSCDFSSSSKRGLTNHQAAHKRIMATPNVSLPQKAQNRNRKPRELLTAAQIRANQDQTWRNLHFPQVDTSISTSNRFQMLEDHDEDESVDPPEHTPQGPTHPRQHRNRVPPSNIPASQDILPSPTPSPSPGFSSQRDNDDLFLHNDDNYNDVQAQPQLTPPSSADDPDDFPLQEILDLLTDIHDNRNDGQAWSAFENAMSDVTLAFATNAGLPPINDQPSAFTPNHIDASNCRVIQRLYRKNRRRAIRLIVEGESTRCHIPAEEIHAHFREVFEKRDFDRSVLMNVFPTNHPEVDTNPFSPAEIRSRLHRFENSAPGPDRLSYENLKSADPDCKIMARIFNICLRFKKIPAAWKSSKSILIHKKGDTEDLNNWRPISLCNTMYKLYTGCLTTRLVNWITDNEILSFTQKGFLPFDSVFEHSEAAANEYIYGSTEFGLLGIPKLAEEVDVMMVDNGFKLLTSKDPRIQELAWGDLLLHVNARTGLEPTPQIIEKFLNGVQDEEGFRHSTCPYATNWSHARSATSRLGVSWRCKEVFDIELHVGDKALTMCDRTKICRSIKEAKRIQWAHDLVDKPSQGAAIDVSSRHKASSHFIRTGDYTTFADWRFVHKARLNLLRLNGNTPWDNSSSQCRRCSAPVESTLHVLSLCKPNMGRRTTRHNAIVDRIQNAKRRDWQVYSKNQVLGNNRLRPDLVLTKGDPEALILDITVPYENRYQAFENARNEKSRKYAAIAALLAKDFKKVSVEAIIVGALGSWDPANDAILRRFANKRYIPKLLKLCVSDAINHSRQIFQKHVMGHIPHESRTRARAATLNNTEMDESTDLINDSLTN